MTHSFVPQRDWIYFSNIILMPLAITASLLLPILIFWSSNVPVKFWLVALPIENKFLFNFGMHLV